MKNIKIQFSKVIKVCSVIALSLLVLPIGLKATNTTNKGINSTYWCAWGGNTSYSVAGKYINSNAIDMDKIDNSYNVIITAFIVTDSNGNFVLSLKDPGSQGKATYTPEQIKQMINDTKAQGRKVIVSIGGQFFQYNIQTEDQKNNFVTQVEKIVDEYGFEGLDLDLEQGAMASNTQLFAEAVKQVVNHYREKEQDFWLTAAPEWCYIVPFMYGSGQWASHSFEGKFYLDLLNNIGIDTFTYICPQSYNEGPANGIGGPEKDIEGYSMKVTPSDGMDKFLNALAWAISTPEGYEANGSCGIQIPPEKLVLGIPALEGAAGGEMTYIATPTLIQSTWSMMKANNDKIAGFMNWSVDWDAMNITDGELSPGYTHTAWATGQTVQKTLNNETVKEL